MDIKSTIIIIYFMQLAQFFTTTPGGSFVSRFCYIKKDKKQVKSPAFR